MSMQRKILTCFRGRTFVYYTQVYPYKLVLLLIGNMRTLKTQMYLFHLNICVEHTEQCCGFWAENVYL